MKITFTCTGCGRSLKARAEDVGRTRKCPVCATRVVCNRPAAGTAPDDGGILEADLIEVERMPARAASRAAPAPMSRTRLLAEANDDPYRLAGPDPAVEPKKPCPICGETILAAAVKCRFCGEILDGRLEKGKSKKKRKSSGGDDSNGPRDIGIGILCMGLGIGLTVATYAAAATSENGGRVVLFYGLILGGLVQFCRGFWSMLAGR